MIILIMSVIRFLFWVRKLLKNDQSIDVDILIILDFFWFIIIFVYNPIVYIYLHIMQ